AAMPGTLLKLDCIWTSGTSNLISRIVGGSNTEEGEWPWQVSLHFVGAAYCGASVISKEWLVSAAHCFQGSNYLGEHSNRVAMRSITRIIVHPQYDQSISDYDIALLEMETPVLFSELVQPICLPSTSRVFLYGTVCYVTGWGAIKENSMFISWIYFLQVWRSFKL
uniref:Transmembrane serine protease 7 n=1 Tax=Ficedula albicollis TaxID=59894 RepID=A0A803VLT2_FICAL